MTLLITLAALGTFAVLTGIAVFVVDSMARATFLLLASFLAVAVGLLALGLTYLGIVVVLMMTIEMMIMVVFMIMLMMNPAGLEPMSMVHNRAGSLLIALGVFVLLAAAALLVPWPVRPAAPGPDPTTALGAELMGPQMPTMAVLGLTLLATIVGAVALSVSRPVYGPRR